jgi:hypothetical protein
MEKKNKGVCEGSGHLYCALGKDLPVGTCTQSTATKKCEVHVVDGVANQLLFTCALCSEKNIPYRKQKEHRERKHPDLAERKKESTKKRTMEDDDVGVYYFCDVCKCDLAEEWFRKGEEDLCFDCKKEQDAKKKLSEQGDIKQLFFNLEKMHFPQLNVGYVIPAWYLDTPHGALSLTHLNYSYPKGGTDVLNKCHIQQIFEGEDEEYLSSFDGIVHILGSERAFNIKIVKVWESLDALKTDVDGNNVPENLDALILLGWLHIEGRVFDQEDGMKAKERVQSFHEQYLMRLRREHGIRIVPSPEYCMTIARKTNYYSQLNAFLKNNTRILVKTIPTVFLPPGNDCAPRKLSNDLIAKGWDQVVFKNDYGGMGKRNTVIEAKKWGTIRDILNAATNDDMMVQPVMKCFDEGRELKLIFVEGAFLMGWACSKHANGGQKSTLLSNVFRDEGLWKAFKLEDAIAIGSEMVEKMAKNLAPEACRFLRVDLIHDLESNCWFVNELEYFGDTHILLESTQNPVFYAQHLALMLPNWIRNQ